MISKEFFKTKWRVCQFLQSKSQASEAFPFESPQGVKVLVTLIIFRLEIKLGFELSDKTPSANFVVRGDEKLTAFLELERVTPNNELSK
jgi:hypothetical protein